MSLTVICFLGLFNYRQTYIQNTDHKNKIFNIPSTKGPAVFQGMTYKKQNTVVRKGLKINSMSTVKRLTSFITACNYVLLMQL